MQSLLSPFDNVGGHPPADTVQGSEELDVLHSFHCGATDIRGLLLSLQLSEIYNHLFAFVQIEQQIVFLTTAHKVFSFLPLQLFIIYESHYCGVIRKFYDLVSSEVLRGCMCCHHKH